VWASKAVTYDSIGKYGEALECIDKALKLNPESVGILYTKGNILKHLNRVQEALDYFNKSLELDPDFEPAKKAKEEILASIS
jgi:tetratricopeptide (TPR) repeat protein